MDEEFESRLRRALLLDLDYPERAPSQGGKPSAVMALFAMNQGRLSLLVTKRAETVESHKGQMAFPGGRCEPDEIGPGDGPLRTALRETEEEVGIPRDQIRVVGNLPGLWTVTGYWIHPFVGVLRVSAETIQIDADPAETAEAIWVPFEEFTRSGIYRQEFKQVGPVRWPIHVFQMAPHRIWVATGSMIKNLIDRLERV